jgi:hypothetical protein
MVCYSFIRFVKTLRYNASLLWLRYRFEMGGHGGRPYNRHVLAGSCACPLFLDLAHDFFSR